MVVMAEHDKEEMELDIGKMEFDFRGTSVICRSGSPLILADLKKVCSYNFFIYSFLTILYFRLTLRCRKFTSLCEFAFDL